VRMLELATEGRPQFAISALDLDDDRPSFTAALLARLRDTWGEQHELFFVMGEDSLRDFPTWREPGRIASLARLVVVTRPGVGADCEAVVRAVPALAGRIHLVPIPQLEIASSDLRARVAEGRPIAFQVPEAVEEFIQREGLYRG
jgi:nicotinate-nucleotide adenylyltransferase